MSSFDIGDEKILLQSTLAGEILQLFTCKKKNHKHFVFQQ
jgi:hypothetical protein